jgi:uroporphyrinogen decarboxylase
MIKEQVIKAFNNEAEQNVPFLVWNHFTPNEHVEATESNGMFDADLKRQPEFVEEVQPDFVKLMNDGYFTYKYNNVDNPKDLASLAQIKPIDSDHSWLKDQFNLVSGQLKTFDRPAVVLSGIFSAVSLFKWSLVVDTPEKDLSTADTIFADLYTKDPQTVIQALTVINTDIKKQINVQREAGVDGVLFSTQEIQDDRIGKDFFINVQKKLDAELIEEVNKYSKVSILHVCGFAGATNHLDWFVDYNLPVVNWATRIDGYTLGEGKRLFKDKVVFGGLGNTPDDVLFKGNRQEIEAEVDRLIDEAGTKGVIIGADCTVLREMPIEHMKWAQEAAHTYNERHELRSY